MTEKNKRVELRIVLISNCRQRANEQKKRRIIFTIVEKQNDSSYTCSLVQNNNDSYKK